MPLGGSVSTISTMAPGALSGSSVNTSLSPVLITTVVAASGSEVATEVEEVGIYSIWSVCVLGNTTESIYMSDTILCNTSACAYSERLPHFRLLGTGLHIQE